MFGITIWSLVVMVVVVLLAFSFLHSFRRIGPTEVGLVTNSVGRGMLGST